MLTQFQQQPRPFYIIFMLEMWERFGFYTVQGILILYFIQILGFPEAKAYQTFGAFIALLYSIVPLGGFLGDKWLGTKRTVVLGMGLLALGYTALALSNATHVFYALGLICVANGLFKANPASLLSKCYSENDPALQGGFTLYYMSINLGALLALSLGPWVAQHHGYSHAYMLSVIGILLGLGNYGLQRRRLDAIPSPVDARPVPCLQWMLVALGVVLLSVAAAFLLQALSLTRTLLSAIILSMIVVYFVLMSRESTIIRRRMMLAFLLMVEAVFFFSLYHQMPASINLFAVKHVHTCLWGMHLNPVSLQGLNPIWIMILSPIMASWYLRMHHANRSMPMPYKFSLGMFFCGLSFLVIALSRFAHDPTGQVSAMWLVGSYFLQSISELLISALGTAMVAELIPQRMMGLAMGMWFLTSSVAGFIGAKIASYTALPNLPQSGLSSLMMYTQVFAYIGIITVGIALILGLLAPRLTRLYGQTGSIT